MLLKSTWTAVTSAAAALAVAAPQTAAAAPSKINLSPEEKIVKNNGAVKTGAGADYTLLNNFVSSSHVSQQQQQQQHHTHHGSQKPSPDVDNRASISMLTLVPSSSTTSLINETKQIHKAGKSQFFYFTTFCIFTASKNI